MSTDKFPQLITTCDGKNYLALAGGNTVERDGKRTWYLAIPERDLTDARLKIGTSKEFALVAVVDVTG